MPRCYWCDGGHKDDDCGRRPKGGLTKAMDRMAEDLDSRFKRATLGGSCWNCGCPDARYVRTISEEDAKR